MVESQVRRDGGPVSVSVIQPTSIERFLLGGVISRYDENSFFFCCYGGSCVTAFGCAAAGEG